MSGEMWDRIRLCWPVLNCNKENVLIFVVFHWHFTTSELSEDEAEYFSTYVTQSEQCAYIRIETLCGNTVPTIHILLKEICGNATLDRNTVRWWHKHFKGRESGHKREIHNLVTPYSDRQHKHCYCRQCVNGKREIEAETEIPWTTFTVF